MSNGILFPAGIVGSIPRPQWVQDLITAKVANKLCNAERQAKMDVAVAYVIAFQEMAGLDVITDGEWRRTSYIGIIDDMFSGLERGLKVAPYWLTVTRKLNRKREGVAATEVQFLKAHTDRKTKVCLPSPYLLGRRLWDADLSQAAYPTREGLTEALIPFLRDEIIAARDAGVDIVQLDDTHLCQFVDAEKRSKYPNPEREIQLCVDMINATIEGISGVKTALHLCRGNSYRNWGAEGGYQPIVPALQQLKVDQYVMEFSMPAAGDMNILSLLPDNCEVGVGCVDCRSEKVDTVEEIVGRVQQALQYLKPEQISLNPDCGFAPGAQFDIPLNEVYQKLQNEAKAAKILRREYASMNSPRQ